MASNNIGGYSFGGPPGRSESSPWVYTGGANSNGARPMRWHPMYQPSPYSRERLDAIHEEPSRHSSEFTYRDAEYRRQTEPYLTIPSNIGIMHPIDTLIANENSRSSKSGRSSNRRHSEDLHQKRGKEDKKTKAVKRKDSTSSVKSGHSGEFYSAWDDPRDHEKLGPNSVHSSRRGELDVQSQVSFGNKENKLYSDGRRSSIASTSVASVKDKEGSSRNATGTGNYKKKNTNSNNNNNINNNNNNLNNQLEINKIPAKTININQAKSNDDVISTILTASEKSGSPKARMKIVRYDGREVVVDIPVKHTTRSRLRNLLSPITTFLIVLAMLGALATALYFALGIKESQEEEIAILQAKLNIALAKDQQARDFSQLTPFELEELKAAYCQEVDALYTRSNLGDDYRGCEVETLTNERIQFKVFFVGTPTASKQEATIIQVLARESTNTGRQGEQILEISEVKLDISERSRFVQMETTIKEKDFYGSDSRKKVKPTTPEQKRIQVNTDVNVDETTNTTPAPVEAVTMNTSRVMDRTILNANICSSIHPETLVAHPHVCSHYIQCDFNQPVLMPCSGGLVFDPAQTACVIPTADLPCTDITPCENNINGGHFAHPTNCHLFVICEQGVSRVMPCRDQMVWDKKSSNCLPRKRGTECEIEG